LNRDAAGAVAFRIRVGGRLLAVEAVLPRPVRVRNSLAEVEGVVEDAGTINAGRK
jgi:hypothetical protein